MPITDEGIIEKIRKKRPAYNSGPILRFRQFLVEGESSERNATNYLKVLDLFLKSIGSKNLDKVTRDDIISFLDSRRKSKDEDPDQRWIVTWNEYYNRLFGFFRWYYNKDSELARDQWKTPSIFENIHRKKNKRITRYSPNDVWSKQELLTVVKYSDDPRNKALLMVMSDGALRNHEVTKLKIKHIVFKEKYAELTVPWNTKTGSRTLPLIDSFPYIRDWWNKHPFKDNPDAFLFVSHTTHKPLKPDSLFAFTHNLKDKIKRLVSNGNMDPKDKEILENVLKKPWNPYLIGRHSSLTEMSNELTDYQLIQFAGWKFNTKRRATYLHPSGREVRDRMLARRGIEKEQKIVEVNRTCPKCQWINTHETKFCNKCGYVLDPKAWDEAKKEEEQIKQKVKYLEIVVEEQKIIVKHMSHLFAEHPLEFPNNDEG